MRRSDAKKPGLRRACQRRPCGIHGGRSVVAPQCRYNRTPGRSPSACAKQHGMTTTPQRSAAWSVPKAVKSWCRIKSGGGGGGRNDNTNIVQSNSRKHTRHCVQQPPTNAPGPSMGSLVQAFELRVGFRGRVDPARGPDSIAKAGGGCLVGSDFCSFAGFVFCSPRRQHERPHGLLISMAVEKGIVELGAASGPSLADLLVPRIK